MTCLAKEEEKKKTVKKDAGHGIQTHP